MKKVLFATTALVATAGVAAADVTFSGYGRFGLDWNEANVLKETNLTSRLRLQVDMTTETDGGVTFGARFRAQAESRDGIAGGAVFNGARFYASAGGLTVGVGNIIGAIEGMAGLYLETRTAGIGIDGAGFNSLVTNVGAAYFNWDAYSSAGVGVNGVEVIYSMGDFTGHLSFSDADFCVGGVCTTGGRERTALSLAYTFSDWTVGLGFQDSNVVGEDKTVLTVAGDLGVAGVRFAYADNDGIDKLGLYGTFEIGAATNIVAFVTDEDNPGTVFDGTAYGLHVSHDLGGGASIEAGWVESSAGFSTVQAGVYFSF